MTGAEFSGVDVDLLADYVGGALTGTPDESVVAALIADDPAWGAAFAELSVGMAAVGAELGRLTPEPMPAELATRLDAMFTAPAAPAAGPAAGGEPVHATTPHLTLVRAVDAGGDGAQGVPAEKPSRPTRRTGAGSGRRLRWATPIAIAAGSVAFVGFGVDYLAGRNDGASNSAAVDVGERGTSDSRRAAASAADGEPQVLASGTDYTAATLSSDPLAQVLSAPEIAPSAPPTWATDRTAPGDGALSRLSARDALQDCLDAITAENGSGAISAHSVDFARFAGTPAVVVRFTAANGFWAWASGPGCGTPGAGADTLNKVQVR